MSTGAGFSSASSAPPVPLSCGRSPRRRRPVKTTLALSEMSSVSPLDVVN